MSAKRKQANKPNESVQALAQYDRMTRALAECVRVDEAKKIRRTAVAFAAYYKQAKNYEAEQQAVQIRMRAERRCGELLVQMAAKGERKSRGGSGSNQYEQKSSDQTIAPTLGALGLTKQQSSEWQKLAAVPDDIFEALVHHGSASRIVEIYTRSQREKGELEFIEKYGQEDQKKKPYHSITVNFRDPESLTNFGRVLAEGCYQSQRALFVIFATEQATQDFASRIGQKIEPETNFISYPAKRAEKK